MLNSGTHAGAGIFPRGARPGIRRTAALPEPTVRAAWTLYLEARRPRWGVRHYNDHLKLARAGGRKAARGTDGRGVTIDMPLAPLMRLPLHALDADTLYAWAAHEAATRPASTRLAWRLLMGFLGWCARHPDYAHMAPARPGAPPGMDLGTPRARSDALRKDQLRAWLHAVRAIPNPVIAAALQVLLFTGARPADVVAMAWEDVDFRQRSLRLGATQGGGRTIALTPEVECLLRALPRRNAWVFSSATARQGAIAMPRQPHVDACAAAGLPAVSLLGLRRSFTVLSEWLEVPAGVVAQIQGYKPRAGAPAPAQRPLALLRLHHERIEAWMLEQAGVSAP